MKQKQGIDGLCETQGVGKQHPESRIIHLTLVLPQLPYIDAPSALVPGFQPYFRLLALSTQPWNHRLREKS